MISMACPVNAAAMLQHTGSKVKKAAAHSVDLYDKFKRLVREFATTFDTDHDADAAVAKEYKRDEQLGFGDSGRIALTAMMKNESQKAKMEGRPYVMIEVGVWLGRGMATWLNADENVHVIGIDPFSEPVFENSVPQFNQRLADYVIQQESENSDGRYALVTGFSPFSAEPFLKENDMKVDLFYIDGGKLDDRLMFSAYLVESLKAFYASNPDAIISGDDWSHDATPDLQDILKAFAAKRGLQLAEAGSRTWFMAKYLEKRIVESEEPVNFVVQDPAAYHGATMEEIMTKLSSL